MQPDSGFGACQQTENAVAKDVIENRAEYRSLCFSTPGLSESISGVILHWETLFQKDATGKAMVDIIKENGMIPGIKVDKGYNKKLGIAGVFSYRCQVLSSVQNPGWLMIWRVLYSPIWKSS